ncbi:hypothetical protein RvY_09913 [Ramazzottius varieornatus]|uniref:CCHC-type domain-containing protein n=1 Tax=Ramazzottius varieornatus TaxID=947166 RepID=A0A1D1VD44_RAMVA|nr:hypothetical protein RvY_09913 [Ramazzottius varieornatus]
MKHAGSTDLEWCREDPDLEAAVVRGNTSVVLPPSTVSRETKCYNCNQYGHIAVNCPAPSTRTARNYDDRRRAENDRGSQYRSNTRTSDDSAHRAAGSSGPKDTELKPLSSTGTGLTKRSFRVRLRTDMPCIRWNDGNCSEPCLNRQIHICDKCMQKGHRRDTCPDNDTS